MKDGRDVWYARGDRGGRRRVPGRAARRRAPAVHPLHVGLDGEAEGHPAHDRRLPDRRRLDAPSTSSTSSPRRTSTGARPTSAGSPATPTSSTGRCQRRDVGDVRGRARLPGQGHLVGAVRALRRDDLLHRADRDPRLHEVGRRVPGEARPLVAAAARDGRRADQPEGVALVLQGDRRRALPDRRHLVADRDRPHHDHAAARAPRTTKPGSAGTPLPGHRGRGRRRATASEVDAASRACSSLRQPVAGDAAHALPATTTASSRPTSRSSARRRTSSATPRARTRTATSGSSGASTT